MGILNRLSSQVGDRTQEANRKVVTLCLGQPQLLEEIAAGLQSKDPALVGDCAEVMTQVAGQRPEWVISYAGPLAALLTHKTTRARWEAAHALAFVAGSSPEAIGPYLARLAERLQADSSTIVRDYAIDAIGNYAGAGPAAARMALPFLKEALIAWDGKHVARALNGLANLARTAPELRGELRRLGDQYAGHGKPVVRKAARGLIRATQADA